MRATATADRWRAPQDARKQKESRRAAAVSSSPSPFGQNEWLVEEMYRKFREDPSSVDPSWHEFLVDYSPEPINDVDEFRAGARRRQRPAAYASSTPPHRRRPAAPPRPATPAHPARPLAQPDGQRQPRQPPRPSQPPGARGEGPAPPRVTRPGAARRRGRRRQEHERLAGRADRHQRAGHPGQGDDRQPRRHQQPPQAHPRRQDQLHPPAGLRDRAGGQDSSRT